MISRKQTLKCLKFLKTLRGKIIGILIIIIGNHSLIIILLLKKVDFRPKFLRSEGTYTRCNSLDDQLDWLHYYMMFIKLGIGRATSDACRDIREGLITREEGCNLVKQFDHEILEKYRKRMRLFEA